jgi:hypothetical protein
MATEDGKVKNKGLIPRITRIIKNERSSKTMKTKELIIREIGTLPEKYLVEILDFIKFLESKMRKDTVDLAHASESSLSKDWLTEEEEEAWKDL